MVTHHLATKKELYEKFNRTFHSTRRSRYWFVIGQSRIQDTSGRTRQDMHVYY